MVTLNCSHNPKQKTQVQKTTLEPVWREVFSFDLEADKADDAELVLVVDDWDMASGSVHTRVGSFMCRAHHSIIQLYFLN